MDIIERSQFRPVIKYGQEWFREDRQITDFDIELEAWERELAREQGGLGATQHYVNAVSALFPKWAWHNWALRGAYALNSYKAVGMMGCASSAKSEQGHLYALMKWISRPHLTTVYCVTTSLMDAGGRGWGHLIRRFKAIREINCGYDWRARLTQDPPMIRLTEHAHPRANDQMSISLVAAGDKNKAADSITKLQGRKAPRDEEHGIEGRMILVLDETQDLPPEILKDAVENLAANPNFHVIALGNGTDIFDALGLFCKPVGGWENVSVNDKQWDIKPCAGLHGVCVRYDGEDSENLPYYEAHGKDKYPFLPRYDRIQYFRTLGEGHEQYWRQHRGFPAPSHVDTRHVLNSPLIIKYRGDVREVDQSNYWAEPPTKIAGIDPAYSQGGDNFIYYPAYWGQRAIDSIWTLHHLEPVAINKGLDIDAAKLEKDDFHYLMLEEIKKRLAQDGILPANVAVDASAGGLFWSMGQREGLRGWLAVDFGGAASDLPVSYQENMLNEKKEPKKARELFANRVTELWYVYRHFLETNQIRGMHPTHIDQMCRREKKDRAGRVMLESKRDMKARIHQSPDIADGGVLALALVRERFGAIAGGAAKIQHQREQKAAWKKFMENYDPNQFSKWKR